MKRSNHLIAATAVTAGLAIGSLTSVTLDAASAATAADQATYDCTTPSGVGFQLPATVSLSNLPQTLTAGVTVPAGTPFSLDLSSGSLGSVLGSTVLAGNVAVNRLALQAGGSALTTAVTDPVLTTLGNGLLGIDGTLGSFTPDTSALGLPIPTSFDLVTPLLGAGDANGTASCTLDRSSVVAGTTSDGSAVTVVRQKAKIKAHQIGMRSTVRVTVKNQTGKAAGAVTAKLHGKKIGKGTLKSGKVRLKVKHLKAGVNRIKVVYAGDVVTGAAKKTVTVKIPRHRR